MNLITTSDRDRQRGQAATAGAQPTQTSHHHAGGHSMKWHMLLCAAIMIAGIAGGAALGFNIAPLACAAMMVAMIWMMAAPAAAKVRHRDQAASAPGRQHEGVLSDDDTGD